MTRRTILFLLIGLEPILGARSVDEGRLVAASRPQLISCDPASKVPCFRLRLNLVDGSRQPLSLQLPNSKDLAASLTVDANGQKIVPFYAMAGANGSAHTTQSRIALILIDVSGSMNRRMAIGQTRFEVARKAAEHFLDGFKDGVDQVAFVPFQSRDVVRTIADAKFASTRDDALLQIAGLPAPQAKNNTALYSAMVAGIDRLKRAEESRRPADVLMITMTDGENDVAGKDDDRGLLGGEDGLAITEAKVKSADVESITIGFGDRGFIDQGALKRLGTKTYVVEQAAELERAFSNTRTFSNDRMMLTFSSPWKDRASLAGQILAMTVALRLPSGATLTSDPILWTTPQIGVPSYEGRCEAEESAAVLHTSAATDVTGWITVVRPLFVVLGYGALFLMLWFWVPQLIWPGREVVGLHSMHYRRGWSNSKSGRNVSLSASNTPVGFGANGGPALPLRNPTDATVVHMPMSDTSRSRLYPMIRGK